MTGKSILCLLIACSFFSATPPHDVRIMTYNIRNAMGMDKKKDFDRVARVIRQAGPDFVALQELDSGTNRSGNRYVLQEVANRCGYQYCYSAAIPFDGGSYGIGLMSREKPLRVVRVPLPGSEEKRTLLMAEFRKLVLFVVHLSLTETDRDSAAVLINAQLKRFHKPVFLAGDFNAEPGSPAIGLLQTNGWTLLSGESFTFPSNAPDRCIDYVFAAPGNACKTIHHQVIADTMASDHRPVLVNVTLP